MSNVVEVPDRPVLGRTNYYGAPWRYGILSDITPFTRRDTRTYQEWLLDLTDYVTNSVNVLDENSRKLLESWIQEVDDLNAKYETLSEDLKQEVSSQLESNLAEVVSKIDVMTEYVNNSVEVSKEYVDAEVSKIIGSSVEVQSSVVASMMEDPDNVAYVAVYEQFSKAPAWLADSASEAGKVDGNPDV